MITWMSRLIYYYYNIYIYYYNYNKQLPVRSLFALACVILPSSSACLLKTAARCVVIVYVNITPNSAGLKNKAKKLFDIMHILLYPVAS